MKGQGTLMLYKKVKYGDIRGKKKKKKAHVGWRNGAMLGSRIFILCTH